MKKKLMSYFILLLPFIDLITSLLTDRVSITPGIIIKCLLLAYLFIYVILSNSKFKKLSLGINISCILYMIFYYVFKSELFSSDFIFKELQYIFKLIFYPMSFSGLLCFFDECNITKDDIYKYFRITLIIYVFMLLIPILIGVSKTTYPVDLKGFKGLFYSGNELSNIMVILLPFSYYYMDKTKYSFLIILPISYTVLLIGTKVSTMGTIIISIIFLLYYLFSRKFKCFFKSLLICLVVLGISYKGYAMYNYHILTSHSYIKNNEEVIIDKENLEEVEAINKSVEKFYNKSKLTSKLKPLLNGRDLLFANTLSIYNNSHENIFFGIGYSNTYKVNNSNIERLVEIDVCDAYFHNGILGLLILFSCYIITGIMCLIRIKHINGKCIVLIFICGLMMGVSCLSGHTFIAPAVTIYISLLLILLLAEFGYLDREEKDLNKISILALHLGVGGVEKAIVDQANMLSNKYNVEIVSIYNMGKIPFKLNKNVNVKYLTNVKPNREEFKKELNNKNIIGILKEGFKAIKILYLKKYSMIKYIYNSNSKVLISSRFDITKLLNNYADNNTIKIAEEHRYHNNDKKYIKSLGRNLNNIDYLLPSSKYIMDDYKVFYKNVNVKYIPLVIDYVPDKLNKLDNLNIISVGRFSPEKGFIDLIHVFKKVYDLNPKIKLTLVGDGIMMNEIKELIKSYGLDKSVNLTGFISDTNKLHKEYENASLYVMTSFEESFGLVLLEAMSYGIPCMAFDSALGAKEIISNGTGKLIKNRDKDKMALEIVNYFKEKDHSNMSNKAREKSLNYTYDKVSSIWEEFINQVIK